MKNKLAAILVGLSLLLGLAGPVYAQTTVQQNIKSGLCAGSNLQIPSGGNSSGYSCQSTDSSLDINSLLRRLVNVLSAIIGVVAVIMIIFGGFRYITSGGNDTSVTSAKNTILYAIIGLIIVALAQALVHFVIKTLG